MSFTTYAQNGEDVMLWRALKHIKDGFYVDVGAQSPDHDSVTRAFYDRGWQGINLEPTSQYYDQLIQRRPRDVNLKLAAGEQDGTLTFYVIDNTGLSTLDKRSAEKHAAAGHPVREDIVDSLTLAEICRRHVDRTIHFLKIDVEGTERAVLAGADFTTFRPWIVLVEATAPNSQTPTHEDWEPILLAADYEYVWFDGLNRFYVASEQASDLRHAFQVPLNVFDDYARPIGPPVITGDVAEQTVIALYRSLLMREPEPAGLVFCRDRLRQSGDIEDIISIILKSGEFADQQSAFLDRYVARQSDKV